MREHDDKELKQDAEPAPTARQAHHESAGERRLAKLIAQVGTAPEDLAAAIATLDADEQDGVMAAVHAQLGNAVASRIREELSGPDEEVETETETEEAGAQAYGNFNVASTGWQKNGAVAVRPNGQIGPEVQSEGFYATSVVDNEQDDKYHYGYIQNLKHSTREFVYNDATGEEYQRKIVSVANVLDKEKGGGGVGPWYNALAVKAMGDVDMGDTPVASAEKKTPDGMGTLARIEGGEDFVTWLAGAKLNNDDVTQLAWATWKVDWDGRFNADHSSFTGGKSKVTDKGRGRHGRPITSGPVANAAATSRWTSPGVAKKKPKKKKKKSSR